VQALYRSAAAYLGLGLAAGLYYRTLTHAQGFEGQTVLSLAHTHLLALGFLLSLALLALAATTGLHRQRFFRPALLTYHAGMAITTGFMIVKGTFEVLGSWTDRPMFNGISGTGHILLTVALTLVMLALRAAVRATVHPTADVRSDELPVAAR